MHILSPETDNCPSWISGHSFARNWQLPFLNQRKGDNDRRKHFMINLHERMLPTSVGVEPATSWSPVGRVQFNPRRGRQHSFVEIDHEIFSTVILYLPLIQEGQLSVSGERMCTIYDSIMCYLNHPQNWDRQALASSVDPDQPRLMWHLIRVCTVCH